MVHIGVRISKRFESLATGMAMIPFLDPIMAFHSDTACSSQKVNNKIFISLYVARSCGALMAIFNPVTECKANHGRLCMCGLGWEVIRISYSLKE